MRAFFVAGLAILVGCKGGKSVAECKTETDALVQTLRGADRSPEYPWAMTVELTADGITHRGKRVELAELGNSLAQGRAMLSMREVNQFGGGTGAVAVKVDAGVPWSRVVALAEALAAEGYVHPIFLVPRAPKSKPPPRTAADDELDKTLAKADPADKATLYAKTVSKLVEPCKPLKKVFGTVAGEVGDKTEILIAGTGEALVECQCSVDMPALSSLMFRVINDPDPTDPRRIVLDKSGQPIALPAATPWKDAANQLSEGASVWLAAK